jgi:hypothetical protein
MVEAYDLSIALTFRAYRKQPSQSVKFHRSTFRASRAGADLWAEETDDPIRQVDPS